MNLRLIPTTIEIYFWSLLIGLLSDSELAQRCVRKVHKWIVSGQYKQTLQLVLALCATGFALGFILGLAGA